jgi:hypothetical protein
MSTGTLLRLAYYSGWVPMWLGFAGLVWSLWLYVTSGYEDYAAYLQLNLVSVLLFLIGMLMVNVAALIAWRLRRY